MPQKIELFVITEDGRRGGNCDYYILEGGEIRHQNVPAGRIVSMVEERHGNKNFETLGLANDDTSELVVVSVKGMKKK